MKAITWRSLSPPAERFAIILLTNVGDPVGATVSGGAPAGAKTSDPRQETTSSRKIKAKKPIVTP
jgi:hypothetical protein